MLSFVLFTFFKYHYFVFLFILEKNHCMLAKREKLKEKMYENQKQTKKNVEGIQNICLSCLL